MIKTIAKAILLWTTMILTTVYLCCLESDTYIVMIGFVIISTLILLCIHFLSYKDFRKLSLYDYMDKHFSC